VDKIIVTKNSRLVDRLASKVEKLVQIPRRSVNQLRHREHGKELPAWYR
jgi:hypothetical protein